jgi:hypothetical protein
MSEAKTERKYTHWEQQAAAKSIAKSLRKRGVKCRVLRGNGSTSPNGSEDEGNYFVIEPESRRKRWDSRDELHLNFDMIQENADAIKTALDSARIPYTWEGDLFNCFVFQVSDFIDPPTTPTIAKK